MVYNNNNIIFCQQGDAVIIPAYDADEEDRDEEKLARCNDGKPIKYLISAPTMRVPMTISDTVNSYLAFRAVILAGYYFCYLL